MSAPAYFSFWLQRLWYGVWLIITYGLNKCSLTRMGDSVGGRRSRMIGGAMALVIYAAAALVGPWLPGGALGALLLVVLAGGAGFAAYAALLAALKLPEARSVAAAVQGRLARSR